MSFWDQAVEIARVDLRIERRVGDVLRIILPFAVVALLVFPLALGIDLAVITRIGPAVFWAVAVLFVLAMFAIVAIAAIAAVPTASTSTLAAASTAATAAFRTVPTLSAIAAILPGATGIGLAACAVVLTALGSAATGVALSAFPRLTRLPRFARRLRFARFGRFTALAVLAGGAGLGRFCGLARVGGALAAARTRGAAGLLVGAYDVVPTAFADQGFSSRVADTTPAEIGRDCDVVLSLDWVDTAGTLKAAWGDAPIGAKLIRVSCDAHLHRGWSMDYQGLPPGDVYLLCEPDVAVPLLLEAVKARPAASFPKPEPAKDPDTALTIRALARAFNELTEGMPVCLTKLPLGWNGAYRHFRHPMDYLGQDGGAGVCECLHGEMLHESDDGDHRTPRQSSGCKEVQRIHGESGLKPRYS